MFEIFAFLNEFFYTVKANSYNVSTITDCTNVGCHMEIHAFQPIFSSSLCSPTHISSLQFMEKIMEKLFSYLQNAACDLLVNKGLFGIWLNLLTNCRLIDSFVFCQPLLSNKTLYSHHFLHGLPICGWTACSWHFCFKPGNLTSYIKHGEVFILTLQLLLSFCLIRLFFTPSTLELP